MTTFVPPLQTGDYVNVGSLKTPGWCVVDKTTGTVITFANSRKWAREFADHTKGERIARVHQVTYEISR